MPNLTFRSSVMGYNKEEVDEYISSVERRVTAQIDQLMRENSSLRTKNEDLEKSSNSQAEVLSGGAHHMREMDDALNKEKLRGDQFEAMYSSVTERNELLDSDMRRLQAEKDQVSSIVDMLQNQIMELKRENDNLLTEIRTYEKQRAMVAELELKAYKRAKDLEYSAGMAFERSRSELQKNLELAGEAFDEFKLHTSRLSTQAVADFDSMRDSFSYLSARISEVGDRLNSIRDIPDKLDYSGPLEDVPEPEIPDMSNLKPEEPVFEATPEPELIEAEEIAPEQTAQVGTAFTASSEAVFTAEVIPEPIRQYPEPPGLSIVRPSSPAPIISLMTSNIFNPFDEDLEAIKENRTEENSQDLPAIEAAAPEDETPVEPEEEITADGRDESDDAPVFDEPPLTDFDTFFDSYLKTAPQVTESQGGTIEFAPHEESSEEDPDDSGPTPVAFRQAAPPPSVMTYDAPAPQGQSSQTGGGRSDWFDYGIGGSGGPIQF